MALLTIIEKDLLSVEQGIIGHGVNCQGVMNSGIAKRIREKYPKAYISHQTFCRYDTFGAERLGLVDLVEIEPKSLYIANMFTQKYYGNDGRKYASCDAIYESLFSVLASAHELSLPIYIPKIGCGLGGLDWDKEALPTIEKAIAVFPSVDLYVCEIDTTKPSIPKGINRKCVISY